MNLMKKTLLILTLLMSAFCTTMAKGEDIIVKVDKNGKATGCKSFSVNNGYFTIDNIDYDIVDDHLEVSLCDDEDVKGNAHIIAALVYEGKRYNVTTISEWAFEDCEYLTSIYIPQGVTTIDEEAFKKCTRLKYVHFPNTIDSIGENAFTECTKLAKICFPKNKHGKTLRIGNGAFSQCENLKSVDIQAKMPYIAPYAFSSCKSLERITIPNGVTEIGAGAFQYCKALKEIILPKSLKSISEIDVFENCESIESIKIDKDNPVYDSRNNCNAIIQTKDSFLIKGCCNTVIPHDIKYIGFRAFAYCKGLKSITIPNNIKKIGGGTFHLCKNLTDITLSDSLQFVSAGMFWGCEKLRNINIPNSVKIIYKGAFCYCNSLENINIPSNVKTIKENAFTGCENLKSVNISNGVEEISSFAFSGCKKLESITIPASVKNINDNITSECDNLKSIKVDKDNPVYDSRDNCNAIIETKTNKMIAGCSITTIPNSLDNIVDFDNMEINRFIKEFTVPDSVQELNMFIFTYCENLKSITIPASVRRIIPGIFGARQLQRNYRN